jgi:hypothetical protein
VKVELNIARQANLLVKQNLTRAQIKTDLANRGFKVPFTSWTIHILKGLKVERYNQLLTLLDKIHEYCEQNLQLSEPLPLRLPWAGILNSIRLDKLMQNPQAVTEVFERCIKLTGVVTPQVSLESLPFIYTNYATTPLQLPHG